MSAKITTPKAVDAQAAMEKAQRHAAMLQKKVGRAVEDYQAYLNEQLMPTRLRPTGWQTPSIPERDLTRYNREQAMAEARQFVENSPIAAAMVQNKTDAIVGRGPRLKMLTADTGWNDDIRARWLAAQDGLDIRQIRSGRDLYAMWYSRHFVDGDVGIRMQPDGNVSYVQTFEADRIREEPFVYLDQGTRFDVATGRPLQYYVGPRPKDQLDMENILKRGAMVSAKDFILYANWGAQNRSDQLRGISGLLQNFNVLKDIGQILEAVLAKIKSEAFTVLTKEIAAGYSYPGFNGAAGNASTEKTKTNEDGKQRRTLASIPAHILELGEGEKASLLGMRTPNAELVPMLRFLLRYAGALVGLPLEMMLFDMSETNFSGGRLLIELAKRRSHVEQDQLCRVISRVFVWWLDREIEARRVKVPSGLKDKPYSYHRWGKPALPYYDPGREAQAWQTMIACHLASPSSILADSSDMDEDEILDQIEGHMLKCKTGKDGKARGAEVPMIWGPVTTRVMESELPGGELEPAKAK